MSTYIVCGVVPHKNVTILYAGMMVSRKCAGTGRSGGKDDRKQNTLAPLARSLSDRLERCANSFFDSSLIALHSFSFTQKIEDHSLLLSVRSIYKSDVPTAQL